MASIKGFLLFLLFIASSYSAKVNSLNGLWKFRDESGEYADLTGTVPGGIYSDLMSNKIIDDIFYGDNDVKTKWVPRSNWTYYTNFDVTEDLLNNDNVNLVFEGLDTFASVVVNDVIVGSSRNMFVRYIFDVKKALKLGENKIEVNFLSPVEVAANLAAEQAKTYVVPPTCPPNEYRGECNVNMIRKMQASYSWDWGPAFASVGIWKDVYLESFAESVIRYVAVDIEDDDQNWKLKVDTYLGDNAKHHVQGKLTLQQKTNDQTLEQSVDIDIVPNDQNELLHSTLISVSKDAVIPWWPNGYGGQQLYDLTVTFDSKSGDESNSKVTRIGFRKIELIQDKLDYGTTFYFKVNGMPIFMKGSNEIPLNILPERGQSKSLINKLLSTARNSHMNMLRVWGGGVYESDYFYDLADEYGILIWQDFMFACAMYPTSDSYLENVVEEVRHQVNRLRSHPSIALFAGNNENEAALRQSWYGTASDFQRYYNDYVKLYYTTIQTEVERITEKRRIYLMSSPSNGVESISEGYVAQNPGDYAYGDVHFYNYVSDPWDSNIYPVSRFTSEYGYQSLPSYRSLLEATNNESDLNINSAFMDHRQHHPQGNEQMKALIEFNLKLPDQSHQNYSKAFIYYLQIAQAVGIKIETEHYRRYRSILNDQGLGRTMGALYWQLNDVWLAPTWAGIDFTGRWKMLQYFVGEFFAPIIITGHINSARTLEIYVVSDVIVPLPGLVASIRVFKWDSLTPVSTEEVAVDMQAGESKLVKSIPTDSYLSEKGCGDSPKDNCFFSLVVKNGNGNYPVGPNNYVFPSPLKNSHPERPNVKIESVKVYKADENMFEVTVSSDKPALFVWLDTEIRGRFSENGFVQVDSSKSIYFYGEEETSLSDFQQSLTISNLLDEQYF
ncbi:beta-mannosidase-like [Diabrotica undecimpunctata]|uniref:beta-mannosidase-like n=1 Tax=Diabrotica undecimpunctata TaxID=50387 RepID=UPI003B639398